MSSLDHPRDRAIQAMFDRIAGRYDFLNRIISFRLDNTWRNKAITEVLRSGDEFILDLGAGTGDLTFSAAKKIKDSGRIIGLDFSLEMLKLALKAAQAPESKDDAIAAARAISQKVNKTDEVRQLLSKAGLEK